MDKVIKFTTIGLQIIALIFLLQSCHNHDHPHGDHGHGDHAGHAHAADAHDDHRHDAHAKMVHLNEAQYLNAEIDTGWYSLKNLSDVVSVNGYTKLDPQDEADVNVPIYGTIKNVKVIEGNYVKKGQTLATMVSLDFNKMLLEKAKLQETLVVEEYGIDYLEKDYERQEKLSRNNINAQKVFQKVSSDLATAKAKIAAVKSQIQILDETLGMISSDGSSLIPIRAPINGYITDLNIKLGTIAMPGQALFSIVNNSEMHVDLLVYEKDLNKIKEGQTVRFTLTNQSNKVIKGKIYNIGKSFANNTKSVAVHADIEPNDANLIPGMYLNALIDIGANKVQTLPEGAVVFAEGRNFIYLWKKENAHTGHGHDHGTHAHAHVHDEVAIEFQRLEVKTGAKQLGFVEIIPLEKIPKGDRIVTNGAYYLQSHLQKAEGGGGHSH